MAQPRSMHTASDIVRPAHVPSAIRLKKLD